MRIPSNMTVGCPFVPSVEAFEARFRSLGDVEIPSPAFPTIWIK